MQLKIHKSGYKINFYKFHGEKDSFSQCYLNEAQESLLLIFLLKAHEKFEP